MRKCIFILLALFLLQGTARAEVPQEVRDALPDEAEKLLEDVDTTQASGITEGVGNILESMGEKLEEVLRQRTGNAAAVLLVVVLCGAVNGFSRDALGKSPPFLSMAGGVTITVLTAGSLDSLMGLGAETIGDLDAFSAALLPALAAAAAASGRVSGAAVQQISTTLCVDILLGLINGLLLPLVYLYVGVLTASCCLGEDRLRAVAGGLKKIITWTLTTALLVFTLYLSVVRVVSGTADGLAVKVTKSVISGVVPVVGGIIAETSETLLAGAGMLKNTIGLFGMLGIFAACAYPFLQLGVQYLLYKAVAFLASVVGTPELCRLIDGLGGAFGLLLGMTGACALLLLISVLSAVALAVG